MSKYTFLFGNGINRAIDNEAFKLEAGMKYAWKNTDPEFKSIICEITHKKEPTDETDLYNIQEQIFKIKMIEKEFNNLHESIKKDLELPTRIITNKYSNYVFDVAKYYYDLSKEINKNKPSEKFSVFTKRLSEFLQKNIGTHIAELNYDRMLYHDLLSNGDIKERIQDSCLCDGFWSNGFHSEHLERKYDNSFGWYLHLHGSPLFYKEDGIIRKSTIHENIEDKKTLRNHIILCSPPQKPSLIEYSYLLSVYFDFFKRAINNSDNIVLIGYGGGDQHINDAIKENIRLYSHIHVIERKEGENRSSWEDKLCREEFNKKQLKIHNQHENILDFNFDFEKLP